MNHSASALCVVALCAVSAPAVAAVVVENLTVKPNPVRFVGGYPPPVELEVTIKDRGITRLLGCELMVDFGDGGATVVQSIPDGGTRKATLKHAYAKAGSYTARARGKPGTNRACEGERRVQVDVVDETPPPEPPPPKEASTGCPPGWSLVPGSQSGPRFKCRADRPAKIDCPGGTKYFEQEGVVGCQ